MNNDVPKTPEDFERCLGSAEWRLFSGRLYKIIVKDTDDDEGLVLPFKPNRAQRRFLSRLHHRNIILKARQLGFCVDPSTRVLTADLRWVRIDSLQAGDEVVAVDEHPPGGRGKSRRMRTATVQAAAHVNRMAYRIKFDDGREVVCTDRHPWLSKKAGDLAEWRSLSGQGNEVVGRLKVGTNVRWVTKPWDEPTVEDGWFGGMLDGEGSIAKSNSSAGINVSQREGRVWDRMVEYCKSRGYNHCIESDNPERLSKHGTVPVPKIAFGRIDEMFRVIGQTRPTRFIGNRFWEGRELPGKRNGDGGWSRITSIEPVGEQTMIDLQTSTGTYIAEGFVSHNTTLIAIAWLDHALFNANARCGIIAHDRDSAKVIFRDKVKFAYDNLPEDLKARMPLAANNADELLFAHNNSSIRVATSMRSGTIHRLHVSEFGKVCAKYPDKATEIVTGSLPAVPLSGITVIESTAEGQEGDFHDMTRKAQNAQRQGKALSVRDYRLHFFPWWEEDGYTLPDEEAAKVVMTEADAAYFHKIEAEIGRTLSPGKRAWYVSTREAELQGKHERMWQEYPSTVDEAFQVSKEGVYYAKELADARHGGRILKIPVVDAPVSSAWDIGNRDFTAIWLFQKVGMETRFIKYYEASGEPLSHYVKWLQDQGHIYGHHYLPHDASHKRLSDSNKSVQEMLEDLGLQGIEIVPRIDNELHGIAMVRAQFSSWFFDEVGCAEGLKRLDGFKKSWNSQVGAWRATPAQDDNCHGADAIRQLAQAVESGIYIGPGRAKKPAARRGSWRSA